MQALPAAFSVSAMPAASGSSGPTTTMLMFSSLHHVARALWSFRLATDMTNGIANLTLSEHIHVKQMALSGYQTRWTLW